MEYLLYLVSDFILSVFVFCFLIINCRFYSYFVLRYRLSQRVGVHRPAPKLTGLPPYCLMLQRVVDALGLSTDAPSSIGVRVTAAELPRVHLGSRELVPFDAIGEFVPLTAGVPSTFASGGTHHRFTLHWEYQDDGN